MEGKGSFFNITLLLILAFLSLTLAALAGYVFLGGGASKTAAVSHTEINRIVNDEDLNNKKLYEKSTYFNLKNDSQNLVVVPVIQVDIEIRYFKSIKGIKDIDLKLTAYDAEIKQLIGTYFQNMTLDEAKQPETKEKASKELKQKINDLLSTNEKGKYEIIYDIVFEQWFYT